MNFSLSEEQTQLRDMVRDFAEKELKPVAAQNDRDSSFPLPQVKKLGELGLMGITVPPEFGGAGMDPLSYVIVVEELSKACASTGVIVSVNNSLVCDVLKNQGTEEQKEQFLTPLANGEKLGAYCLTEPQSGSDAANLKTVAKKKGNSYIIDGSKNFITNGPQSDLLILFAVTDPTKKARGVSAFVVETKSEGVEIGKEENKLGVRASGTCSLSFSGVKVPASNLIGKEGEGFKIALATLDSGRIGIAAQAVGIAQAALDEAISYAKMRKQFGKPLAQFQGLRWKIADMATRLEAARLLTYEAATLKAQGKRFTKYSAMAKLFASETATSVANSALQIHGGYGFTKEYPVERFLRDARVTEIYEGTSEIQRLVIAGQLKEEFT